MTVLEGHINLKKELSLLQREILKHLYTPLPILSRVSRDVIISGGKRLRPVLMFLIARQGDYRLEKVLPYACVVEIIHIATLIHDDIIDDASYRRGLPSTHAKWTREVAVFTGDFLLSRAFSILAQQEDSYLLRKVAEATGKVCEGEIEQYENRFYKGISALAYFRRIRRKTASLFALSCEIGARLGGLPVSELSAIRAYGVSLGLAFQLRDDILDFVGKKGEIGKPVLHDMKQGVYTLPIILAIRSSEIGETLGKELDRLSRSDGNPEFISHLVERSGGIATSQRLVECALDHAKRAIRRIRDGEVKRQLFMIADLLRDRKR